MVNLADQYDIEALKRSDIDMIAQIFLDATRKDLAFVHDYENDDKTFDRFKRHLERHIDDCTYIHVKAVVRETGLIVGYASWYTPSSETVYKEYLSFAHSAHNSRGGMMPHGNNPYVGKTFGVNNFDSGLMQTMSNPADYGTSSQPGHRFGRAYGSLPDVNKPDSWTRDHGLFEYLERYYTEWRAELQNGCRYIRLAALLVHPSCQLQGLGKRLVEYGFQFSDGWQMRILALATSSSWPVLHKCGFVGKRFLDVDLRAWVRGGKASDKGYGRYSFRLLVREPAAQDPVRAAAVAAAEDAARQVLSERPVIPSQLLAHLQLPPVNQGPSGSTTPSDQRPSVAPTETATATGASESPALPVSSGSPSPAANAPSASPSRYVDCGTRKRRFRIV